MARNNIKGVKNEHTWKFYTILSSVIGVLIIALIIGLIITYNVVYSDSYENVFSEYTEYKMNANEFDTMFDSDHVDERGKYTIIFAYDESYMTQSKIDDLDSDDPNKDAYVKANKAISDLMASLDENHSKFKYNSKDSNSSLYYQYRVDMYFINTSLLGNIDFLSSKYVGSSSSSDGSSSKSAPAVFVLDSEGKYVANIEYNDDEVPVESSGTYSGLTKDLRELKDLVVYYNNQASDAQ